MLFDLNVKTKREDFFNYEREYLALKKALDREKVIAVLGIRRVGKTSLMSVIYNEIKEPKIWIDGREVQNSKEIYKNLLELWQQVSLTAKALTTLTSLQFGPLSLEFKQKFDIKKIDKNVKRKAFIFIDEAQKIENIDDFLAYLYDSTKKITVIIAGSEVGIMENVLGKKGGAMAGRLVYTIKMEPLSEEQAKLFLRKGFLEIGLEPDSLEIEDAVDKLGTLAGWLTYYGHLRKYVDHNTAIGRVIEDGKIIVMSEFNNFLARRRNKRLYVSIMKFLAKGCMAWSDIYHYLHSKLRIGKSVLSEALHTLEDYGFIIKSQEKYRVSDPMLRYAFL